MIDPELDGKVVLITGANHGIGASAVKAFASQGSAVFINYFGLPAPDELIRSVRNAGGRVVAWAADLTVPAIVSECFARAEEALGPVDILVNNAAHSEPDTFLPEEVAACDIRGRRIRTVTPETHDRHFAVNCRAPALLIAEYARRYVARKARWGRVISVSTEGAIGYRDEISYWASKNGLESLSRSAAEELAPYGVTVNIVSPGAIQTGWIPREKEAVMAAKIPLQRIGQPEDVADVIVFLASHQARYLTGQTIFVGGGSRVI